MTDSPAAASSGKQRGVSARSLIIAIILLIAVGAMVLLAIWFFTPRDRGLSDDVDFVYLSDDDTATVGFAGSFPVGSDVLSSPTGMDGDGEYIYVAERDAGWLARFTYGGGLVETIAVPPAEGREIATPISVAAMDDGRVAVVDSASGDVLLLDPDSVQETVRISVGANLVQPTSVIADGDRLVVAEATTGTFEVFDADGTYIESLGDDLDPPPTFVGGMRIAGPTLYASDSNAGRVLLLNVSTAAQVATLQERLGLPRGIAVDDAGRVIVADAFDSTVLIFDGDDYMPEDAIGDENTRRVEEGGALGSPQGLVWDSQTRLLYVADTAEGKVKVYEVRAGQ
jgi:DNA-binding beta-propeller fold protein YncE